MFDCGGSQDCCHRGVGSHATGYQCLSNDAAFGNTHQHHDGAASLREGCPVDGHFAVLAMPRHNSEHRRNAALRHRNSGSGRSSNCRGDAGNDFAADALERQRQCFFATATEHEWVAAFETHDPLALARKAQQQHVDESLRRALTGALTNIDQFGIG